MTGDEIRLLAKEIAAELHRLQNRQMDSDFDRTLPSEEITKSWRSRNDERRKRKGNVEAAQVKALGQPWRG